MGSVGRGRAKLLKPPTQIWGHIYYRKLAIVENAGQLKKGILLWMASNMCRLRAGCELWHHFSDIFFREMAPFWLFSEFIWSRPTLWGWSNCGPTPASPIHLHLALSRGATMRRFSHQLINFMVPVLVVEPRGYLSAMLNTSIMPILIFQSSPLIWTEQMLRRMAHYSGWII